MNDSIRESSKGVGIVLGVGEGMGAALARRFAAGHKVALIARSGEIINRTAEQIRSEGGSRSDVRPFKEKF